MLWEPRHVDDCVYVWLQGIAQYNLIKISSLGLGLASYASVHMRLNMHR